MTGNVRRPREICNIHNDHRWSGTKHVDCWDNRRTSTAHCQGRRGGDAILADWSRRESWARSGRYRRPSRVFAGCVGWLGAGRLQFRVSGRLARARPDAACHSIRVAAAHCDERERCALFTSQNSNDEHTLLSRCIIPSSRAAVLVQCNTHPRGPKGDRDASHRHDTLCVPCHPRAWLSPSQQVWPWMGLYNGFTG